MTAAYANDVQQSEIHMASSRDSLSQEVTSTGSRGGNSDGNNPQIEKIRAITLVTSVRWAARYLLLVPHALCLMVAAWLLAGTPTLNLDDLQIAEWATVALSEGWGKSLASVLFNLDLGVWQPRTYGLARAIQYVEVGLFGSAPVPGYLFIILAHFGSGALVYQIVRKIGGDTLTAVFAALAWMASPAVLPLLKAQHYFLYLIAPYYPLFGWLLLSVDGQQSKKKVLIGALLLTIAWWLGEGVTFPILVLVVTAALLSGSWRRAVPLVSQGVIAAILLFLYLGYQHFVLRDPAVYQRFKFAPDLGLVEAFLRQLWQNGRAVLGLPHHDSELGLTLGGIGVLESPVFWGLTAVLTAFGVAAVRFMPSAAAGRNQKLALLVVLTSVSSLALYLVFMVIGMGVFPARYAAAFFALVPLAIIVGLLAYAPNRAVARMTAAMIAALSIALTLTSLHRAEVLVSQPNRVLLKKLQGRAVILHLGSVFDENHGGIAGLVPVSGNGLANPMRSFWTAEVALRLYADASIGDSCRMMANEKARLFSLGQSKGVFPLQNFVVEGSSLTPEQICK